MSTEKMWWTSTETICNQKKSKAVVQTEVKNNTNSAWRSKELAIVEGKFWENPCEQQECLRSGFSVKQEASESLGR